MVCFARSDPGAQNGCSLVASQISTTGSSKTDRLVPSAKQRTESGNALADHRETASALITTTEIGPQPYAAFATVITVSDQSYEREKVVDSPVCLWRG